MQGNNLLVDRNADLFQFDLLVKRCVHIWVVSLPVCETIDKSYDIKRSR